jgi:hypothetical protein
VGLGRKSKMPVKKAKATIKAAAIDKAPGKTKRA